MGKGVHVGQDLLVQRQGFFVGETQFQDFLLIYCSSLLSIYERVPEPLFPPPLSKKAPFKGSCLLQKMEAFPSSCCKWESGGNTTTWPALSSFSALCFCLSTAASEYQVDDQCLVLLLKGLVLKHLHSQAEAEACFSAVHSR